MSTKPLTKAFERLADEVYHESIETAIIGVDAHGKRHTWHQEQDAVVVHYGRDVETVHYLDGRPLDDWVRFVRDLRGWEQAGPEGDRLIDADLRIKEGR